ncbi:MAG: DHA2 family efflux MFS transporter permease subunit [Alphaproteobacteria bacterium]
MTDAVSVAEYGLPGVKKWLALSATMLGLGVYMLTMTLSGAALPRMQGTFSAAPDQMAWLLTSFVIGTTIMTACSGWIAVRFGRTRFYCIATAGFTLASVLCGLSTSLEEAILFRTLQGVFGAPLLPLGQAIAADSFPPRKQGMAVALWSMGGVCGTIFGPYFGGMLIEEHGWPWVFFVNVPLGVLAFLATAAFVPETKRDETRHFSWPGFALAATGIAAFQLALNRGQRLDWFDSPEIVIEAAVGVFAIYLFGLHLTHSRRPFFDPTIFRDRNYVFGLAMVFIHGAIIYLQMFLMPILLQDLAGYGIQDVGRILAWRAVGIFSGMLVVSQVSDRIDPRIVFGGGFLCVISSAWSMSLWTMDVRAFDAGLWILMNGMGSAVTYVPISLMGFSTLPKERRNEGMALFYLAQTLGTATGTALIFNVLTRSMRVNHDSMSELLSPYNEMFQHGIASKVWSLAHRGGLAAVDAEISRQASMIAYNNSFYFIALTALLLVPLTAFMRLPSRK